MARVRLHENTLFVIKNSYEGSEVVVYYQSPTSWTSALSYATIFRDYEVAEEHLIAVFMLHGNDGSLYDIVPMKGEMERVSSEKTPK